MHALLRTSFGNASPMHVLQKAGETIYVPFPLIHSVLNMDTTVAITSNFGSRGNLQKVWETVLRKGSIEQWIEMHNEIMTDEQYQQVQEGDFWPPEKFVGVVIDDEGDSHCGGVNGHAGERAGRRRVFVYEDDEEGNKFQYNLDEL